MPFKTVDVRNLRKDSSTTSVFRDSWTHNNALVKNPPALQTRNILLSFRQQQLQQFIYLFIYLFIDISILHGIKKKMIKLLHIIEATRSIISGLRELLFKKAHQQQKNTILFLLLLLLFFFHITGSTLLKKNLILSDPVNSQAIMETTF